MVYCMEEVLGRFGGIAPVLQEKATSSQGHSGTKTILIIEDDESIGEVIALALMQEAAYTSLVVDNSDAALALLTSQPVHLLLIDYHLANKSGLDVYDHLHTHEALRALPVIIMSASLERHEQELRERNLAGLSKPFDIDDLLILVKQAIG